MIKILSNAEKEHLEFIRQHGDYRITHKSYDHYARGRDDDILLECRQGSRLIGISFSASDGGCSITVVRRNARSQRIGTEMMLLKKELTAAAGIRLQSTVATTNIPSIVMCSRVFETREMRNGKYLFHDGEPKCAV